jgi:hypothetical protein
MATDEHMEKQNFISLKDLVKEGYVHWKSDKSVRRAIVNEHFPHFQINGQYFFDLVEVRLWYKKRERKAS